jgi:16S rRNA G966 N2-methylase RsmD
MSTAGPILRNTLEAVLTVDKKNTHPAQLAADFYNEWYQRRGTSYYFLFKKNLNITNMQYAEFISLLKCHVSQIQNSLPVSSSRESIHEPTFTNADEVKEVLSTMIGDFFIDQPQIWDNADALSRRISFVSNNYEKLLHNILVLNPYFGSTTVYLPPNMGLNLTEICAQSGYIHSCGRLIYVRNMIKASVEEFQSALQNYLNRYHISLSYPPFFRTYSHEDFDRWDRAPGNVDDVKTGHSFDLSDGLDEIKISTRKAYFGTKSIVNVLRDLKTHFNGKLVFAEPGNYKEALATYVAKYNPEHPVTFFLVNDGAIEPDTGDMAQKRYYICYDQLFYNDDPLYIFEEDKPGWIAHTTIPHSLARAMINITRPWRDREVKLLDPFGGSGTIFLESVRQNGITWSTSTDVSEPAIIMCLDNIKFFSADLGKIEVIIRELEPLLDANTFLEHFTGMASRRQKRNLHLQEILNVHNKLVSRSDDGVDLRSDAASALRQLSLTERLAFYVLLRTDIRHVAEHIEGRGDWFNGFKTELSNQLRRMYSYLEFLRQLPASDSTSGVPISEYRGSYSNACTISVKSCLERWNSQHDLFRGGFDNFVSVRNALDIKPNSYDLIITDPPYGFNTSEDDLNLAELYGSFVDVALRGLRTHGHLVICCPAFSYSGRRIPMYARPEMVIRQVLTAAGNAGREIRVSSRSTPDELKRLRPPYYWDAPSALRRSILHFQVV